MPLSIRLNDLADMDETEREEALSSLVEAAKTNGAAGRAVLNARIRRFEERYEISSDEMLRRLASGEMKETAEIAKWLFLLNATRERVAR
ncbi:MAG TPA: hypothetical protein VFX98_03170 [Longimicrobiaceae bacterium]|nr:hypothetical protein [Longimicrobiaceae bacterium]